MATDEIHLPSNVEQESTILVQMDPDDDMDFTGATGAIGRLEVDEDGVVLDLKGNLYRGLIYPGATAMVISQQKNGYKVEAITDEFCRLSRTGDALDKFDAHVQGDLSGYLVKDDNVNRRDDSADQKAATGKTKKSGSTVSEKRKKRK